MAMLRQGGIGEAIMIGMLEQFTSNGRGSIEGKFRNVVIKELMHGWSLIRPEEGEGSNLYAMHRLVRRFILNEMGRGSAVWNDVYSLALPAIHDVLENELRKQGYSFYEFPDVFETNHREFVTHTLALVHHHVLQAKDSETLNLSEVENIHEYSARVMEFMGKSVEEVEIRECWLAILHHEQAENRKRSCIERLRDLWHQRNRGRDVNTRIAHACTSLALALMGMGEFNRAALKLRESLEIRQAVYGHDKRPLQIAQSLRNLGFADKKTGRLDEALEKYEQRLEMYQEIHGHGKLYSDIAWSFGRLGFAFRKKGRLDDAVEKIEQSLEMYQEIHGQGEPHPDIALSLGDLGLLYQKMGRLDDAVEKHEQRLEMYQEIHGQGNPHPDIAGSLGYLGLLYQKMGRLQTGVRNHPDRIYLFIRS